MNRWFGALVIGGFLISGCSSSEPVAATTVTAATAETAAALVAAATNEMDPEAVAAQIVDAKVAAAKMVAAQTAAKAAEGVTKPAAAVTPKAPNAPNAMKPKANTVKFGGPIAWETDHAAAMARSKAENKPVMLLIYADWCPKCRALGPIFADDTELHKLAESVVMLRADQDDKPPFISAFQSYGGYVPRIFFLNAAGGVDETLKAPHPKYPYFYATSQIAALKVNLKTVAAR